MGLMGDPLPSFLWQSSQHSIPLLPPPLQKILTNSFFRCIMCSVIIVDNGFYRQLESYAWETMSWQAAFVIAISTVLIIIRLTDHFSGPSRAFSPVYVCVCVCVCVCVRTITYELNDLWLKHLASSFILIIPRSCSKATVIGYWFRFYVPLVTYLLTYLDTRLLRVRAPHGARS